MARDDDKKRRGGTTPSTYIKYGLGALVVGYVLFSSNVLPAGAKGGAMAGLRNLAPASGEQQVPVPKTPRSVIRFYDGNTVVT